VRILATILSGLVLLYSPWSTGLAQGYNLIDVAKAIVVLFLPFALLTQLNRVLDLTAPIIYSLAWVFVILVQAMLTPNQAAYSSAKELILSIMFFATLVALRPSRGHWEFLSLCLATGCVIAMFHGAGSMKSSTLQGSAVVLRADVEGINANHIAYSCVAAMGMVAGVWMRRSEAEPKVAVWYSALVVGAVGLLCMGIALCATRGAMISLGSICCVLTARALLKGRLSGLVCALAIAGFAALALVNAPSMLKRFEQMDDESNRNRLQLWSAAWELIVSNPLMGVGPGQFPEASGLGVFPHNGFLSILAEFGLLGFSFYAAIVFCVLLKSIRQETLWTSLVMAVALLPIVATGVWERQAILFACLAFVGTDQFQSIGSRPAMILYARKQPERLIGARSS